MKDQIFEKPETPSEVAPEVVNSKNKNIKYPFNGVAPNLIDKFLVLGYEHKTIEYTLQFSENSEPEDTKTRFRFFDFQERPSIINEICYDYSKDLLDNDLLLELIFPNLPQMYLLDKENMNEKRYPDEELLTSSYSIIFSINPQDNNGSKKSYNGLGFIFYYGKEHKNFNNEIDGFFYSPIAYVILSEYPYYYHFNEICKNLYFQMKKENDEIPIDIILYNVVKYCPSPINASINLSFGVELTSNVNKNMSANKILDSLKTVNYLKDDKNGIPSLFFEQLSGYPFLDINLSFIFNLIPPEIICEVFIFSFLEHDIIFYSQNPEILNIVMYIFSNLNYPFNDSIYYWHVLSVSKENFMSGTSTFVGKTCSTLTGILSEYDSELLTTKKIREHFVLDIDNKNFFFLFQEETEEVKETMDLYSYIKNCSGETDEFLGEDSKADKEQKRKIFFNDGIQLYEAIRTLMDELQRRAKKVTAIDYNEKQNKPTFLSIYEDESEMECMKSNIRLQKAFFAFITQIIQNFVSILGVEDDSEFTEKSRSFTLSVSINQRPKDKNNIEEEEEKKKRELAKRAGNIFKEKFKDCSKYSSFVINFCKFHETIDLYKIPYTFINEFIYYSHVAEKQNLSEVDVFKLIDQFYGKRKMVKFEEIIKNKEEEKKQRMNVQDDNDTENIYSFSFDEFAKFYKEKLRASINREQEDDKDIFIKVKGNQKSNYKKYKRNGFFLSKKILNYYIKYTNNYNAQIYDSLKLVKCEYILNSKNSSIYDIDNQDAFWLQFEVVDKNDHEIILNRASSLINKKNKIIANQNVINENKENKIVESTKGYIDYNSIKTKDKFEKDLIFFGDYEFMEITDVIERHFILERCFTSYGLIKFSLLNILAITRGIDGQKVDNRTIIQLMCDFCEITKSLVRKYMNLYLNIFQALVSNGTLNNDKEYEECLNNIALYFKKTNMIPTEETTKTFNEINSIRSSMKSNVSEIKKEQGNDEKGELNIENQFFEKVKPQKYDSALKVIETIFTGKFEGKTINLGFGNLNDLYELFDKKFIPETPLSLYTSTNRLLNKYLKNKFCNDKNIYAELENDILSLLYYLKISAIGKKWIENYKVEEIRITPKDKSKDKKQEKNKDKNKDKNKEKHNKDKEKNKYIEKQRPDDEMTNLNKIINKLIYVLDSLYKIITIVAPLVS